MPTSTVRDAGETGRLSAPRFGSHPPWSDQLIVRFLALSLVAHVLLLAVLRLPGDADGLALLSDFFVQIELQDTRDPEFEIPPPPLEPPEEFATRLSEPLTTQHDEPGHSVDISSVPQAEETNPAPPQEGLEHLVASTSEPVSGAADPSEAEAPILTTTGPSDIQHHSGTEEAAPSKPAPVPIPDTDQEVLTRKVIQGIQTLQETDSPQLRLSWQDGERRYVAMVTRHPAADSTDIERAMVEIEAEHNGERLRTQMQMKRLAFSHYTQLINRWDRDVQLHDDIVSGRFHSNSEIVVAYDRKVAPLFMGKVTTAARGFSIGQNIGRRRRAEIFPEGFETRAEKIRFPEEFAGLLDKYFEGAAVHSIEGDAYVTFFPEGSYGVVHTDLGTSEHRQIEAGVPTYILGGKNSTLHVSGVVRGKVLVYSPERIVIKGDLTYANDPRKSADSEDYLGLISDKYIQVASPRITGPGDLEIHAAVYAKRRFDVISYESRHTGTLFIYGSLAAGTISATEPRYATTIEFDPRFERVRPPGFPLTNKYEIETWDAQWQRVEP